MSIPIQSENSDTTNKSSKLLYEHLDNKNKTLLSL